MAHVFTINSAQEINCGYGMVLAGFPLYQRWTPKAEPVCTYLNQNLDDRFITGDSSAGGGSADMVVDGC